MIFKYRPMTSGLPISLPFWDKTPEQLRKRRREEKKHWLSPATHWLTMADLGSQHCAVRGFSLGKTSIY